MDDREKGVKDIAIKIALRTDVDGKEREFDRSNKRLKSGRRVDSYNGTRYNATHDTVI